MSPKPSLSKRGEILNLLRRGKLERGEFWDFRFIPNTLGYARLVLVISKRHVPRAVRRNRLRRVIREFFRQQGATGTSKDLMIRSTREISASTPESVCLAECFAWLTREGGNE